MAGQIAQLVVPADGGGNPEAIVTDWARGRLYFVSDTTLRSYQVALETQSPILSSQAFNSLIFGADADPVTGALLINRPTNGGAAQNADPLFKFDPSTFAVIGSFGASTSVPAWPTSFYAVQSVVCVGCGTQASGGATQIGYAFLKEYSGGGTVGVVRTDTMQQAGFHQVVVTGSTLGRGHMVRGASGPSGASVFLSWSGETAPGPTLPLYTVAITPGAETYNPSSWPATNPHITSRTVGTIAAASVDPTWSHLQCASLGYDTSDGNVLMLVTTNDVVTHQRYLIKVNASNAAVIWATALPPQAALVDPGLMVSNVNQNIIGLVGPTLYSMAAAGTGVLTSSAFGGLAWPSTFTAGSQGTVGSVASDTAALFFVGQVTYGPAANAPTPVAGTPSSFSNGYALIGGLFPPPPTPRLALDNVFVTAQATLLPVNLISLRWSDDRGHSYGSPVTQDIGEAGEYRTSLQWQRLSYARDRVFEISWSAPMRTALQGCWVDVTPAQS